MHMGDATEAISGMCCRTVDRKEGSELAGSTSAEAPGRPRQAHLGTGSIAEFDLVYPR